MENEQNIVDVKVIDLIAAACAVDVYKSVRRFLTGSNIKVSSFMAHDNKTCTVLLKGVDIQVIHAQMLSEAVAASDYFIHSCGFSGEESYEFVFELMQ